MGLWRRIPHRASVSALKTAAASDFQTWRGLPAQSSCMFVIRPSEALEMLREGIYVAGAHPIKSGSGRSEFSEYLELTAYGEFGSCVAASLWK